MPLAHIGDADSPHDTLAPAAAIVSQAQRISSARPVCTPPGGPARPRATPDFFNDTVRALLAHQLHFSEVQP